MMRNIAGSKTNKAIVATTLSKQRRVPDMTHGLASGSASATFDASPCAAY